MTDLRQSFMLLILIAMPVHAEEMSSTSRSYDHEAYVQGQQTRAWLEMQRNGYYAAPHRGFDGKAAKRTYDRYLQSFEQPLPSHLDNRKQ